MKQNRMIAARKAAGLSLEQAADMVGIKPSTLKRYQSSGVWSYELAQRLCHIYRCPLDFIMAPRGADCLTGSDITLTGSGICRRGRQMANTDAASHRLLRLN